MATEASFVEFVLEQVALPGRVDARKMFGEYALYVDGKVVALLCDNQLFLKPLAPLRARLARVDEAAPYPGAKPHFRIADELERPAELTALLAEAARLLPEPKPKAKVKADKPEVGAKAKGAAQGRSGTKAPTKAQGRTAASPRAKTRPEACAQARTPAGQKSRRKGSSR